MGVATGHSLDEGSDVVKRVRLTRKTHVGVSSVSIPDQGHSTPRRLELEWSEVFAPGDAWNLPSEGKGAFGGKGRRVFCSGWSVQPKGSVHWH